MNLEMPGSQLEELRCILHANREAVAKCPSCSRFYCRECVVEHGGKMLCKSCLDQASAETEAKRSSLGGWLLSGLSICISVFITTYAFFLLGRLLLSIPEDFHASPSEFISESMDE